MEYGHGYRQDGCFRNVFCSFVCVTLCVLLGLQMHAYFWRSGRSLDGVVSDILTDIMELQRVLSEANCKYKPLRSEVERILSALPQEAAAAGRAKEALIDPLMRLRNNRPLSHTRSTGTKPATDFTEASKIISPVLERVQALKIEKAKKKPAQPIPTPSQPVPAPPQPAKKL